MSHVPPPLRDFARARLHAAAPGRLCLVGARLGVALTLLFVVALIAAGPGAAHNPGTHVFYDVRYEGAGNFSRDVAGEAGNSWADRVNVTWETHYRDLALPADGGVYDHGSVINTFSQVGGHWKSSYKQPPDSGNVDFVCEGDFDETTTPDGNTSGHTYVEKVEKVQEGYALGVPAPRFRGRDVTCSDGQTGGYTAPWLASATTAFFTLPPSSIGYGQIVQLVQPREDQLPAANCSTEEETCQQVLDWSGTVTFDKVGDDCGGCTAPGLTPPADPAAPGPEADVLPPGPIFRPFHESTPMTRKEVAEMERMLAEAARQARADRQRAVELRIESAGHPPSAELFLKSVLKLYGPDVFARGSGARAGASRARRGPLLGRARFKRARDGKSVVARVRLNRRTFARLKRAKRLRSLAVVTFRDAAGKQHQLRARFTLRPPRPKRGRR